MRSVNQTGSLSLFHALSLSLFLIHCFSFSHTTTHSFFLSHTLPPSLYLSVRGAVPPSQPDWYASGAHTQHTLFLSRTHTLYLSLSHTHIHSLSHTHTLSFLSLSLSHIHSLCAWGRTPRRSPSGTRPAWRSGRRTPADGFGRPQGWTNSTISDIRFPGWHRRVLQEKSFHSKPFDDEVYCTNALLSLMKILVCSQLHFQRVLN